jgi:hypothetical protein
MPPAENEESNADHRSCEGLPMRMAGVPEG